MMLEEEQRQSGNEGLMLNEEGLHSYGKYNQSGLQVN